MAKCMGKANKYHPSLLLKENSGRITKNMGQSLLKILNMKALSKNKAISLEDMENFISKTSKNTLEIFSKDNSMDKACITIKTTI